MSMLLAGDAARTDAAARPNIVMIISDDQAWTDYGFMQHPHIRTPNLDRLAASSAVFPRGHVPTALCRPSLATLVSGRYAHQHLITGNDPSPSLADPGSPQYAELRHRLIGRLDRWETLPRALTRLGYRSFQSGKWWEGSYQRGGFSHGMTRGFPEPNGRHGDAGLMIGREGMAPILQFIDQSISEQAPFFVWYAPFLPHTPHNPPEELLSRYRSAVPSLHVARYFAMCEWFDTTCGALLDGLQQRGVADRTIVVYLADNGWIQDPDSGKFAPRSKQSPYEGGVRQPIMIRWPDVIRPGSYDSLVSSVDIFPTLLSALGADAPADLPGIDLMPVMRDGARLERDTIYGEAFAHDIADLDRPQASLLYRWAIEGNWKLILTYDGQLGRYAEIHDRSDPRPQLFDLQSDPQERTNLASRQPQIVARLARKIAAWWDAGERRTVEE
jgi:uncharacterized sulfatase